MSALAQVRPGVRSDGPVTRRVTWRDHVWLTLRLQERAIVAVVLIAAALVALLVYAERDLVGPIRCDRRGNCTTFGDDVILLADVLLRGVSILPLVIALFWGVPVVAREIEARTTVLAWTQDVSRTRWLLGRVATLAMLTVLVSGTASYFAMRVTSRLHAPSVESANPDVMPQLLSGFGSQFEVRPFELLMPMTLVYSLTGLVLGVALGALFRQVLPAIAVTAVALIGLRLFVAMWWRPRFREPERIYAAPDEDALVEPPVDSLVLVHNGWADAAGNHDGAIRACAGPDSPDDFEACVLDHGLQRLSTFHPVERIELFRWLEVGIFATIGAASLALTIALVHGRLPRRQARSEAQVPADLQRS